MGLRGNISGVPSLLVSSNALALSFTFSGADAGGVGTATMDILGSGTNSLTITVDNTSPTSLISGSGINTPGITGFGFDGTLSQTNITSWSMTAKTSGGSTVTIDDQTGTGAWVMNTKVGNIKLDFLPTAGSPAQIKGALYSPAAVSGFGATPNYFTQATLQVNFNQVITVSQPAFVRMQNVGLNGEGSLKLPGTPCANGNCTTTPEPASFLLFGSGLAGLAAWRYRKSVKS